jgi:hypothetical protein
MNIDKDIGALDIDLKVLFGCNATMLGKENTMTFLFLDVSNELFDFVECNISIVVFGFNKNSGLICAIDTEVA